MDNMNVRLYKDGNDIIVVYKNGVERRRVPLVALENVEKATWFDAFKEVSRNWNGK